MPILEHPRAGTILECDFTTGFEPPEMVKRRTVIVLSPKVKARPGLCTVVCCSTTAPDPAMPYHALIDITPPLPPPWSSAGVWIKGDMVYAVSFRRLSFIRSGKDISGKRIYRYDALDASRMVIVRKCVLHGLGLGFLTKHLDERI
jgi:mRNA interferase MazF